MHLHTAVEEVKIERLLGKFNKKTKKMEKFSGAKFLKQGDQGICRFRLDNMVAMDKVIFRKLRRLDHYFLCRLRIFQQWVDSQFEMKVKRLLWGLSRRSSNKLEPFQSVTFS